MRTQIQIIKNTNLCSNHFKITHIFFESIIIHIKSIYCLGFYNLLGPDAGALIKALNDIHLNTDSRKTSVLVPPHLRVTFKTNDHKCLLQNWVAGKFLNWFRC